MRMRHIVLIAALVLSVLMVVQAQDERWEENLGGIIYSTALSADGSVQVVGTRNDVAIAYDTQGDQLWEFETGSTVWGVDTSEDGQLTAIASEDRNVYLVNSAGEAVWQSTISRIPSDVAVSRDGSRLVVTDDNRNVFFYNQDSDEPQAEHRLRNMADTVTMYGGDTVRAIVGTRDSQVILLSSDGDRLWNTQLSEQVTSISVNRNGRFVVAGSLDGKVTVINGANAEIIWQIDVPDGVNCTTRNRLDCINVDINADGSRVLASTRNGNWYLLNGEDGTVLQEHSMPGDPTTVAISNDGAWLMFGNRDGLVRSTTLAAAQASYERAQQTQRNLIVGIPLALVLTSLAGSVWVQRTQSGRHFWDVTSRPGRILLLQIWRSRISYIMLLPTIIMLLIFNYYPAASGLYHSFTDWNPGIDTTWVGLDQFGEMLDSQFFWVGIQNTILLAVSAFFKLLIPLMVAEFIFHIKWGSLQYMLRTLFVIPLVLPSVVGVLLWVNIYDPNIGLLNNTLISLGLDDLTRAWLGDRDLAMPAIIFIGAPWVNPLALLIFYGGLIGIPNELFDAAKVDGATAWKRFRNIDIPLLMGQIRLLVILVFIGSLQEFQLIFLTTAGGPGNSTYTPALELYYQATRFSNFGLASAMGTFLFLIILGGTIINIRTIRSQTEYEA